MHQSMEALHRQDEIWSISQDALIEAKKEHRLEEACWNSETDTYGTVSGELVCSRGEWFLETTCSRCGDLGEIELGFF